MESSFCFFGLPQNVGQWEKNMELEGSRRPMKERLIRGRQGKRQMPYKNTSIFNTLNCTVFVY